MDVIAIAGNFSYPGELVSHQPFGGGHINDTFLLTYSAGSEPRRYILRRINQTVFKDPAALIQNTVIVCRHIGEKIADSAEVQSAYQAMRLVPANTGGYAYKDNSGEYWCSYRFVEETVAVNTVATTEQAFEAARAFGRFQAQLADLPPSQIVDTIPWFHHLGRRYKTLEQAIERDVAGRNIQVRDEIDFVRAHQEIATVMEESLKDGSLPLRVIHNDTKVNNVLLDERSGSGVCVIDLDTVMPGSVIYDFGDMVRTFTSPADEDEQDLSRISMRIEIFDALTRGYLLEANDFLADAERNMLVFGAKYMTLIMGVRFLTDYLMGDVYYKTHRPTHNLDRARSQFELLRHIEAAAPEMEAIVARYR